MAEREIVEGLKAVKKDIQTRKSFSMVKRRKRR